MAKIYLFNNKKEPLVKWNELGIGEGMVSITTYLPTDMICVSCIFVTENSKEYYVRQRYFSNVKVFIDTIEYEKIPYVEYIEDGYVELVEYEKDIHLAIVKWLNDVEKEMNTKIKYVNYDKWCKELWNKIKREKYVNDNVNDLYSVQQSKVNNNVIFMFSELFNNRCIVYDNPIILYHYENFMTNKISKNRTGVLSILQNLSLLEDEHVKNKYPKDDKSLYLSNRNKGED